MALFYFEPMEDSHFRGEPFFSIFPEEDYSGAADLTDNV